MGSIKRRLGFRCVNSPDLEEVIVDYGLRDIVAERFDAGLRTGEQIAKDMVAVTRR